MPLCGALGLGALYVLVVRPRAARWGATDEEATRRLPGDGVVPRTGLRRHAGDHHRRPAGGRLALDRPDGQRARRMVRPRPPRQRRRSRAPSEVIPQLQELQVGDLIPWSLGKEVGPRVLEMEPARRMLWATDDEFTWEWVLEPRDGGRTRLISRIREQYPPLLSRKMLYALVASTGDVVMNWTQLKRIKRRAERLALSRTGALAPKTTTSRSAS